MIVFVEVVRELYKNGKVDLKKIQGLLAENKISQEQYEYIVKGTE